MTYCTNANCPFKDCDTHPSRLEGQSGEKWFASLDSVCKRYIRYMLNKAEKEVSYD